MKNMKSSNRKSMSPLLLESICVKGGEACLLPLHQKRVDASLSLLAQQVEHDKIHTNHCKASLSLSAFVAKLILPQESCHKLRLIYDAQGDIHEWSCDPYKIRSIRRFVLRELPELDYALKWADRSALSAATRGLSASEEPLICQNGWLCDASYANLLFGEPGNWTTPTHCLLAGVKQASLLASGNIKQAPIHRDDLGSYPFVSIINAMIDPEEMMLPTPTVLS